MPKRNDAENLNNAVSRIIAGFKPPENITVTEWAEKYRRLSPESSAEPGLWRTQRTPYLKEPMDAFTDSKVRSVIVVAASQVGKSELELNIIGYIIDQDPGSILYVHPNIDDCKKFSKLRVAPMIRDSKRLRSKVSEVKSRDSGNTILQKSFPGGMLTICGTNSASALASTPVRYIIGDERDRWATSAGQEGDPWELAKARQTTFYNAKSIEVSTPTIKNASAIEAAFDGGTRERWCSLCPDCGAWHDIVFQNIHIDKESETIKNRTVHKVKSVGWVCPSCGCYEDEMTMKKQPAKWIAENPEAYNKGIRSFWLNAFTSQWVSWTEIAEAYLSAVGDSRKLQVVYNTKLGELWENRGELEDESSVLARREDYKAELPDGVLVVTAGVDTQDDRFEYEIVGHGHFGETWGLEAGIIMGRPDDPSTWEKLDEVVFDRILRFENGAGLRVSMSFIDEGGHFTQDVRQQCRERLGKKVFAIAGSNKHDAPFTAPPRKQKIVVNKTAVGSCWRYDIGVDAGKQIIMDNLRVQKPGSRYCHFPRRDDYGPGYFAGLLSEHLVYKPERKQPWIWEKIPGHERNERLDCRNYALAAFKALPADLDAIDKRLKVVRGESVPAPVATAQAAKIKPQQRGKSSLDKYYDDW